MAKMSNYDKIILLAKTVETLTGRHGGAMKRSHTGYQRGTFSHVYLLYGEEAYLRKQYRDKLKCALGVTG